MKEKNSLTSKKNLCSLSYLVKKKIRNKFQSSLIGFEIWLIVCASLVLIHHNLPYPNKMTRWISWFFEGGEGSCAL